MPEDKLPNTMPILPDRTQLDGLEQDIHYLLSTGEVSEADRLYRNRLGDGEVFLQLPAPRRGLEIALRFLEHPEALEQNLGAARRLFYLNEAALFASEAGEPERALTFVTQGQTLAEGQNHPQNLSALLQNRGEILLKLGRIMEAHIAFEAALKAAQSRQDRALEPLRLARVGYSASLMGERAAADSAFYRARHRPQGERPLEGLPALLWAEHLLRTGDLEAGEAFVKRLLEGNAGSQVTLARCDALLARFALRGGRLNEAKGLLEQARSHFSDWDMRYDLTGVLLTEARVRFVGGNTEGAMAACEEVLRLAAAGGYRLYEADALNVRARSALAREDTQAAHKDAQAALQIAKLSGYADGQAEALGALSQTHSSFGQAEEAARLNEQANLIKQTPGQQRSPDAAQPNLLVRLFRDVWLD